MPQYNSRRGRDQRDQREQRDQDDFRFEIVRHYGVLSTSPRGWIKELNLVRWNGRDPKYDIREWQPDHQKMSKGITMTHEEIVELYDILESTPGEFRDILEDTAEPEEPMEEFEAADAAQTGEVDDFGRGIA